MIETRKTRIFKAAPEMRIPELEHWHDSGSIGVAKDFRHSGLVITRRRVLPWIPGCKPCG